MLGTRGERIDTKEYDVLKNVPNQVIGVQMTNVLDGTEFKGQVDIHMSNDGANIVNGEVNFGACVHRGDGYHNYFPSQAETNYDHIAFSFSGNGAITAVVQVYTTSATAFTLTLGATIPLALGEVTGLTEPLVIGDDYTVDVGRRIPVVLTDVNGAAIAVAYGSHQLSTNCTIKALFHPEGKNTVNSIITGTCEFVASVGATPAYLWLTLPRSETTKAQPGKYQLQIEARWTDLFNVTLAHSGVAEFVRDIRRVQ